MKLRSPLFRKHLIIFVVLAGFLLLASGMANLYFSWQESRDAFLDLQRERAQMAADGIAQRVAEVVRQIGTSVSLKPGQDAIAYREHEIRMLRQLPAISDILLLDHDGRELLRLSRNGADAVGSKTDYSRSAAFQEARTGQPYFSPTYLGGDNEPHMTIAVAAEPEAADVTVAEIDLRFLLNGLERSAVAGRVYVTDARGQVIAFADPELKLQKAEPASPANDIVAQAMVVPLGWKILIEPSSTAALVPLSVLTSRSVTLLLVGLLLAVAAGLLMACRTTKPIFVLQESVERITQTVLTENSDSGGANELDMLTDRFRQLAQRLQEEQAQLERRVDERTRAAEHARQRLSDMIDALPLAVFQFRETADGEFDFTFVSENVRDVLGVSAAEIMEDKQARWRTTLPEDRLVIEPLLRRAHAARQLSEFHQRVQIGGATRWIRSCTSAPRQVGGGWIWNGYWLDETQARRREEEMQKGREEAESLARARSAFLSNISQEIRIPLNSIISLSHQALKTELTESQFDCVNKIHQAGSDLFGIINDILDFARIDAGKLVLESTSFRLGQVIDNVAAIVGPVAAGKGLALTFNVPPNLPSNLIGDPLRLEQILVNLVRNAIDFTERGEVTVRVERVYSMDIQTMLRFVVRDTGIGMTVEQRERLFQILPREDLAGVRKQGGVGLGLIICKRLVEMMGGAMAVESKYGFGSLFSFTARFGLGKDNAAPPNSGIDGMRVLLVEDNALNQQVAAELLEVAGAQVDVADNGRIALDKLKSDAQFDIVLMDLQMPEMDGFEATAALRSDPAFAELPVLALTAHGTDQDRARCFNVGMNDHLSKPIVPHVLIGALKRWDRRTPAQRSERQANKPASVARQGAAAAANRIQAGGRVVGRISKETFQQLVGYLSSGDCVALDCFAAHRDELTSALGRHAEQLEQAIGRSDFETALGLLDKAMTRLDFGFGR